MSRFYDHAVHGALWCMPFLEWSRVIRSRPELGTGTKCVALVLGTYSDGATGGNAFPKQETLADCCAMTDRSVRRHLTALEDSGFIVVTKRGGRRGDGTTCPNVYQLTAPVKLLNEIEAAKVGVAN